MASEALFYKPGKAPDAQEKEAKELGIFLERELVKVADGFAEHYYVKYQELHVAPEKPRDGMTVYADGTNWNPGYGEGTYARVNGVWVPQATAAAAVRAVRTQTFTASGTYTPHAAMLYCIIEAVGGGGGGGGVAGSVNHSLFSGGGASGGYSRSVKTAADIGASKAVTIGAGAPGGAAGFNHGGVGGTTSVGSLVIANGGPGGFGTSSASYGYASSYAAAGTGDLAMPGMNGMAGTYANTNTFSFLAASGQGANSHFGRGGSANYGGTGVAGVFGGGGGGTGIIVAAVDYAGGAGGSGLVVITEFCSA